MKGIYWLLIIVGGIFAVTYAMYYPSRGTVNYFDYWKNSFTGTV